MEFSINKKIFLFPAFKNMLPLMIESETLNFYKIINIYFHHLKKTSSKQWDQVSDAIKSQLDYISQKDGEFW